MVQIYDLSTPFSRVNNTLAKKNKNKNELPRISSALRIDLCPILPSQDPPLIFLRLFLHHYIYISIYIYCFLR